MYILGTFFDIIIFCLWAGNAHDHLSQNALGCCDDQSGKCPLALEGDQPGRGPKYPQDLDG